MSNTDGKSALEFFCFNQGITFERLLALAIAVLSIFLSVFMLYTAYFGQGETYLHRSLFTSIILILTFFLKPLKRKSWKDRFHPFFLIDLLFILLVAAIQIYLLYDYEGFQDREATFFTPDMIAGAIYTILIIEATRRCIGWPMVGIILFFIAVTLTREHLWPPFFGPTIPWTLLVDSLFTTDLGIFGTPIYVMSSFIVLFLIFGALLLKSGAGQIFTDLAYSATKTMVGGPAKACIIASALFGTISGSPAANVVTTGTFTIPLMKQIGLSSTYAGAVEAAASTGGQIMPPVMVAAFVLAMYVNVPYIKVCAAAAIPALLFYGALFFMVHLEAKKTVLKPLPMRNISSVKTTILRGVHLFFSIAALLFFMISGKTVTMAAFWGLFVLFALTWLQKESRITSLQFLSALEEGAANAIIAGIACAAAGIIIGCISITALGMKFSWGLLQLSGGHLWLLLVLCAIAALILGMGIPPTAVYITLAVTITPAIEKMGVPPLAAHLFCFYFACIAFITPPVAIAAFVSASVAGSNPMSTGFRASLLGIAAYFAPFMFIYSPALLIFGSNIVQIVIAACIAFLGVYAVSIAVEGYLFTVVPVAQRVVLAAAGLCLVKNDVIADLIGICLIAFVYLLQRRTS